mmetsp:Transcript_14797/g.30470  ORF Transcript_14797/g.30470 Transcript_14797/m.30470 type:complete len:1097 (-) Transcript_14797:21-3311(-)
MTNAADGVSPVTVALSYTDSRSTPAPKPLSVSSLDASRALAAQTYLMSTIQPGRLEPDATEISQILETSDDLVLLGGISRSKMEMNEMVARVVKLFELRLELKQLDRQAANADGDEDDDLEEQLVKIEVGLTLLAPGSKSSKLARAYKLLSETSSSSNNDDEPSLTTSELTVLFEAFLTAIFATISSSNELDVDEADGLVTAISNYAAAKVTQYAGSSAGITFDDFGTWYNEGGFDCAPWLELLDLDKWAPGSSRDQKLSSLPPPPPPFEKNALPPPPPSAPPATPSNVVVSFDFPSSSLSPSCSKPLQITITDEDLDVLREVVVESGMGERSPEELTQFLNELSPNGLLSYSTVVSFVKEILPSSNIKAQNLILVLYGLLDREETGQIEVADFAAGFTIFCSGNKSSKLACGFQQFDDDDDDRLSRRGLWRFLRSFLAALMSVSLANETDLENPLGAIYDALDAGAVWTASQIFDFIAKVTGDESGLIGFEEFASWYTEGDGYKLAPWLELLDLGKFLSLSSGGAESEEGMKYLPMDQAYDEEIAASVASSTDTPMGSDRNLQQLVQQGVLFSFPLAATTGSMDILYLTKHDVEYVRILVGQTGLDQFDPDDVFGFFSQQVQWNDVIDRSTFIDTLNKFVLTNQGRALDPEVLNVFSNFFSCYDEFESGTAKLAELMWGISLFCKGEKSAKLAFAFELFDTLEDGALSDEQLFEFLYSLLTMIFSCTSQGLSMSTSSMLSVVGSTAAELTQAVMRNIYDQGKQKCGFDDFGDWYNAGGFEMCPWLELLALRKWTDRYDDLEEEGRWREGGVEGEEEEEEDEEEDDASYYDDEDEDEDEAEGEERSSSAVDLKKPSGPALDTSNNLRFLVRHTLPSPPSGTWFSFTPSSISAVRELVTATGLHGMDFKTVSDKFLGKADEGTISKSDFDCCIRELIPKSNMEPLTRRRLSGVLSGIFKSYDREGSGNVDALEFAAGFTVLANGSKSDKLSYAFEILDSDMDGKLSRRGMWRFARGFLTMLIAISRNVSSCMEGGEGEPVEDVDDFAVWVSAAVFGSKFARGSRFVEFDVFADWYTSGGYVDASWFELLDLKKWCVR